MGMLLLIRNVGNFAKVEVIVMNSFSSMFGKGEELIRQMTEKANELAVMMKEEEWVQKVSQSVNDVCI